METSLLRARLHDLRDALLSAKWLLLSGIVSSTLVTLWRRNRSQASNRRIKAASDNDPSLLNKHTTYETYTTVGGIVYPRIRTFYKEHQQRAELPKDLPLLVLVHGLGGSISQFAPLLTSLINLAPCLAIDLPGCGLSDFLPHDPGAYSTHALALLLSAATEKYRDVENKQKVVLICHSMGCSIAALLASSTNSIHGHMGRDIIGMIAICPSVHKPTKHELKAMRRLGNTPIPVFNLFRWFDRRGGLRSRSVERMVGKDADNKTRALQLQYNKQSQSAVFLRMVKEGPGAGALPGREIWAGVKQPLFLVAGEADTITPPAEVEQIAAALLDPSNPNKAPDEHHGLVVPATASDGATAQAHVPGIDDSTNGDITIIRKSSLAIKDQPTTHSFALKTTVFPAPAAHGLMYASTTVKILAGMIENFLANHIDQRLGAAWQLQHLTKSGKWDVKNLKKWQAVDACSAPIAGLFRAMKTMREVDEVHCPKEFVERFGCKVLEDGVAAVVDISHETPVYHPKGLEDAGVEYHKFPTVSKEKPRPEEVERFIALVDQLRDSYESVPPAVIGVHCHYGFNRTGFLIVCYLVERMGYRLQDALEEFAEKRPPGIKHPHFETELHVRYAVKMERRGTVVGT